MSVLTYQAMLTEVTARCRKQGLTVVFEDENCQPRTTWNAETKTGVIYLPPLKPEASEEYMVYWWYMFEHELSHHSPLLPDDPFDFMDKMGFSTNSLLGFLFNMVDDHRDERVPCGVYAGRDQRIQAGWIAFEERFIKPGLKSWGNEKASRDRLIMETVHVFDTLMRSEWQPECAQYVDPMLDALNPQQREWFRKLCERGYDIDMRKVPTCMEQYAMVLDMLEHVFGLDPEEEEKKARDAAQQPSGKDENKGEQAGGGNNNGQEQGEQGKEEGDDGSATGEGEDDESADAKKLQGNDSSENGDSEGEKAECDTGTVNYEEFLVHAHKPASQKNEPGGNFKFDYTDYSDDERRYPTTPFSEYRVEDYSSPAKIAQNVRTSSRFRRTHDFLEEAVDSRTARKVRRLLAARAEEIYMHGMKKGRISAHNLYRVTRDDDRVFKQRSENDTLNRAVTLLVDSSGSMYNAGRTIMDGSKPRTTKKYLEAYRAAIQLGEAISTLGVPLEILAFTTSCYAKPFQGIVKPFGKRFIKTHLFDAFAAVSSEMGSSNSDGESILWAYDRLLRQPTKSKMLIVLSDGKPAAYGCDAYGHTKAVVKEIEAHGLVDCYGIGILDSNVKAIYTNHAVLKDPRDLDTTLLELIKKVSQV